MHALFTIMPGHKRELEPVVDSRRFVVGVPSDRVRERFCPADGTSHSARLEGLRILVVDDSADARTLTSSMLTQAGASVRAVASVKEALQILELERPDALVSEIGLPDRDGQAHVSKPVEPAELIAAIAAMTQYLRNSANGARAVGPGRRPRHSRWPMGSR